MTTANDRVLHHNKKPGIYIHIPFCLQKCNYCAFLSAPASEETREKYVEYLIREIRMRAGEIPEADTIYLGGGTPSLLTPEQIRRIIDSVYNNYSIDPDPEITMEANPATLTPETLTGFREAGINRLSMGAQSMNDERLSFLGRVHTAEDVVNDFFEARRAGFDNINIDLIFSIPGSTLDDAMDDLDDVIDLGPEHISFYSLQLEEGTPFFRDFEAGRLREVPDEVDREIYRQGVFSLRMNGYEHYEISNFAKPGYWSRHNYKYWSMVPYLGVGLGASSFVNGRRIMNEPGLKRYFGRLDEGELPQSDVHVNTRHDDISEAVFTGLRRVEGIHYEDILESREEFFEYYKDARPKVMEFVRDGYIAPSEEGLLLTEKGIDVSNQIMSLFV